MAARYYAIASYPNLKSDVLALESDTLCRQTYKKVFAVSSSAGVLIEDTFTVSGKRLQVIFIYLIISKFIHV